MKYFYGMRLRGFAPGCQPMEGFLGRVFDGNKKYHDVLMYENPLDKEYIRHFSLTPLYAYEYTDNTGEETIHTFDTMEECTEALAKTLDGVYEKYCAENNSWDVTWINRLLDCGNTSEVYVPGTDKFARCEIQRPVRPIYELIKEQNKKPIRIGNLIFRIEGVNCLDDEDIDKKVAYDDDEAYSYKERYEKAIAELTRDTEGMTLNEAQKYYKDNTDDDNANYYGDWIYVYTKSFEKNYLSFGVRMD